MCRSIAIIGAGMAGLTTTAYLSCPGLKVDVYEQHTLPLRRANRHDYRLVHRTGNTQTNTPRKPGTLHKD